MRRTHPWAQLFAAALLALTVAGQPEMAPVARADVIGDLQQQIAADQLRLNAIAAQMAANSAQAASLSVRLSQLRLVLADLDARAARTQAQLTANQATLADLAARERKAADQLAATEADLARRQALLNSHVRSLDKVENRSPISAFFTSTSFTQFMAQLIDVQSVIGMDSRLAEQLKRDRDTVAALKAQLTADRERQAKVVDEIAAQKANLDQALALQEQAMRQIAATQAAIAAQQQSLTAQSSELTGRIAADQAQLQSLYSFSAARVGSGGSILPVQVLSDAWGTYYNQRDARWGNILMGNSGYQVWQIGCLVTSVAMVNTHFGRLWVTPATIATNPTNFTGGGLLLNSALEIPGHSPTIQSYPSRAWIVGQLNSGGTVIVGMYAAGGTHFVVLVGVNGAYDYWMNDPWNQAAMHVSFIHSDVTGPIYTAIAYH